ncbi:MAG: hypothetical protein CO108_18590 [Deltaproteobacteria bacterium CG_4_9_14_3_um_filter_63_12]|nr:MAG: hypothetical protein COW42_06940 [Deltaproteobacteria bacterium CG17_big_fil_post_rev_8_21_14_2_50_63_7]PJB38676.1 MAG: hypothetical protein CO108_18590 [Deltaproteobacteria bacterium CG_4_9_14_3_um_filter_63_12]
MVDETPTTAPENADAATDERLAVSLKYRGTSQVVAREGRADIALFGNTYRTEVRAAGKIKEPIPFREALSVLYEVVASDFRYKPKDRTAYLAYQRLKKESAGLAAWQAQQAYFDWLQRNDPNAWTVLDPVISVHPDELFFEVFSKDEGTYAKLSVDWSAFELEGELKFGTTNVDFSSVLYDGVQRMRSYRDTHLSIGGEGLAVQTVGDPHVERTVQLPMSWVRGFLQVQSAATLPRTTITVAAIDLYNLLRQLRLNADTKKGGRALRVELVPGECPRIVLEPWEQVLETKSAPYKGRIAQVVKLWGRRRLMMLRRLLPFADSVDLHLLGSGLPSFYVLRAGAFRMTLGLTGFTTANWGQSASFDLLLPRTALVTPKMEKVLGTLSKKHFASLDDLAKASKLEASDALEALQQGSQQGKVIFDIDREVYRIRPLTDEPLDLVRLEFRNNRERQAHDLLADKEAVKLVSESMVFDSGIELVGKVKVEAEKREYRPQLTLLDDGRIGHAECTCKLFRTHKLKEGPCAHLIALRVLFAQLEAKRKEGRGKARARVTVESRTYVKREAKGEQMFQLSLDKKRFSVRWGLRGQELRLQKLFFNEPGEARDAYFERVDELEAKGFLDASA